MGEVGSLGAGESSPRLAGGLVWALPVGAESGVPEIRASLCPISQALGDPQNFQYNSLPPPQVVLGDVIDVQYSICFRNFAW